jgi:hypothetical protein
MTILKYGPAGLAVLFYAIRCQITTESRCYEGRETMNGTSVCLR